VTVTGYNDVVDCQAGDNTVYRIFTGTDSGCHDFLPINGVFSTDCVQFEKGGETRTACGGNYGQPSSVFIPPGNEGYCAVYIRTGCHIDTATGEGKIDNLNSESGGVDKVCAEPTRPDSGAVDTWGSWCCGEACRTLT
jgi:hypothetical protein